MQAAAPFAVALAGCLPSTALQSISETQFMVTVSATHPAAHVAFFLTGAAPLSSDAHKAVLHYRTAVMAAFVRLGEVSNREPTLIAPVVVEAGDVQFGIEILVGDDPDAMDAPEPPPFFDRMTQEEMMAVAEVVGRDLVNYLSSFGGGDTLVLKASSLEGWYTKFQRRCSDPSFWRQRIKMPE